MKKFMRSHIKHNNVFFKSTFFEGRKSVKYMHFYVKIEFIINTENGMNSVKKMNWINKRSLLKNKRLQLVVKSH